VGLPLVASSRGVAEASRSSARPLVPVAEARPAVRASALFRCACGQSARRRWPLASGPALPLPETSLCARHYPITPHFKVGRGVPAPRLTLPHVHVRFSLRIRQIHDFPTRSATPGGGRMPTSPVPRLRTLSPTGPGPNSSTPPFALWLTRSSVARRRRLDLRPYHDSPPPSLDTPPIPGDITCLREF
jgi:hypothetical protein